jgi:hypothetical protein
LILQDVPKSDLAAFAAQQASACPRRSANFRQTLGVA